MSKCIEFVVEYFEIFINVSLKDKTFQAPYANDILTS